MLQVQKTEKPKTSNIFHETLFLSVVCNKCSNDNTIFKEAESIEILTIIELTDNINE